MSGWFGTSNRGTNNPLDGIAAGHAARRNMQKQRYSPMGRTTIDQMAAKNMSRSNSQEYKGFNLVSTFNNNAHTRDLNKKYQDSWNTRAIKKGMTSLTSKTSFRASGSSKGESVNKVKNQIDKSLGQEKKMSMFTDASSESIREVTIPKTDPGEVARFNRAAAAAEKARQFKPVPMPADFNTGIYTVRAVYGERNKTYTVSVIEGTVVKEVKTFNQNQGMAAKVLHQQFKTLAAKKTNYDGQKPLSVSKTNYNVELQVTTAAAGLSGFFNGVMNMFGLGRTTIDQMAAKNMRNAASPSQSSERARFARRADSGIDRQRATQAATQAAMQSQSSERARFARRAEFEAQQRMKAAATQATQAGEGARFARRAEFEAQQRTKAAATQATQATQAAMQSQSSERARFSRRADSGIDQQRLIDAKAQQAVINQKMLDKQKFEEASRASVVIASKRPEVTANWSAMPAKSFKVITSRKDGTVVKESGVISDYKSAAEAFQTEVSTIENTPDFYDQDAPLVPEVPISTGDGGDITSNYQDPIIAQASAAQQAAAQAAAEQAAEAERFAQQAAAQAAAEQAAEAERFARRAELEAQQRAAAQTVSENYNELVQSTEPEPIYRPLNLEDYPWILKQQASTALAPAAAHSHLGLVLVGLAGLAYVTNRK